MGVTFFDSCASPETGFSHPSPILRFGVCAFARYVISSCFVSGIVKDAGGSVREVSSRPLVVSGLAPPGPFFFGKKEQGHER